MGFFGSGDKIQTSADNRIGVSDQAQLAANGGFIFNGGGGTGASPAAIVNTTKINLGLIAAVVVVIWAGVWFLNQKR